MSSGLPMAIHFHYWTWQLECFFWIQSTFCSVRVMPLWGRVGTVGDIHIINPSSNCGSTMHTYFCTSSSKWTLETLKFDTIVSHLPFFVVPHKPQCLRLFSLLQKPLQGPRNIFKDVNTSQILQHQNVSIFSTHLPSTAFQLSLWRVWKLSPSRTLIGELWWLYLGIFAALNRTLVGRGIT